MPISLIINKATASSIDREFVDLRANWVRKQWLSPRNRYRVNCIAKINRDIKPPLNIAHGQLREYIAASAITHCLDGWSYLGRAIESHLRGDHDTSRHLGYYAELRAAMALLATAGIGVFQNHHFVVVANRTCEEIPRTKSTHAFVWEAFQHWAGNSSSAELVLQVIQPESYPLAEWLDHFSTPSATRAVLAKEWLLRWGVDLERFTNDHDARNLSSYRPTAFTSPRPLKVKEALSFITQFWNILEPGEALGFPNLDKYLLRQSLEKLFSSAHGRSSIKSRKLFRQMVKQMLDGLPLNDLQRKHWATFLADKDSRVLPALLEEARGVAAVSDPLHNRQVLARGAVLLRLATGACRNKLKEVTDFDRSLLRFWWSPLGEDRGLWHSGEEPERFSDLWIDVREAIGDLNSWKNGKDDASISYMKLWREKPGPAGMLGTCERIGLWGLGL